MTEPNILYLFSRETRWSEQSLSHQWLNKPFNFWQRNKMLNTKEKKVNVRASLVLRLLWILIFLFFRQISLSISTLVWSRLPLFSALRLENTKSQTFWKNENEDDLSVLVYDILDKMYHIFNQVVAFWPRKRERERRGEVLCFDWKRNDSAL